MSACDHHEHAWDGVTGDGGGDAVWHATDRHGVELGDFCADHLGDGLDGFDGHVNLDRIEEG